MLAMLAMTDRWLPLLQSRSRTRRVGMRLLLPLLALCACLLAVTQGSIFIKVVTEHPEQRGKCLYNGMALEVGRAWTERSSCTKLTCSKDTAAKGRPRFTVQGEGCNHASSWPENCFLEEPDRTKDFPDCCPQLECDGPPEGSISLVG